MSQPLYDARDEGAAEKAPEVAGKEWTEAEQIAEPVLLQAQKLVEAAGSIERARHALDELQRRQANAGEPL